MSRCRVIIEQDDADTLRCVEKAEAHPQVMDDADRTLEHCAYSSLNGARVTWVTTVHLLAAPDEALQEVLRPGAAKHVTGARMLLQVAHTLDQANLQATALSWAHYGSGEMTVQMSSAERVERASAVLLSDTAKPHHTASSLLTYQGTFRGVRVQVFGPRNG